MKNWKLFSLAFILPVILLLFATPILAQEQRKKICINGVCYDLVQPTVAAATPAALAVVTTVDGVSLRSDTLKFKRSLLQAARQARRSGDISIGEHLAIIAAAQRPVRLEQIKTAAHELAIEDGLATATAIDWGQLIAFLEKLIPLIVKLIGLFG